MNHSLVIAADDFGLTRGVTDTILETVDRGPVTLVSVIPNGEAVDYAIEEYAKRSERLALAVHLNLTEGQALSPASDIPLLVDKSRRFKYSVAGLWFAYLIAGSRKRQSFRAQVRREMAAQLARIREASGVKRLVVNGHQHVHLIPFVFDELIRLPDIVAVRTVREPFQWTWSPLALAAWCVLNMLSVRASRIARLHSVATNDSFIGFVHSGHMTEKALQRGLARARGSIEALFHPGGAEPRELTAGHWSRTSIKWLHSPWRAKERETLVTIGTK